MSIVYKDQYQGVGGSYILDPKTGVRKQVQEPPAEPTTATRQAEVAKAQAELADAEKILGKNGVKA